MLTLGSQIDWSIMIGRECEMIIIIILFFTIVTTYKFALICVKYIINIRLLKVMKMKNFYSGKRLLVTGTTGFLGKVLL